MANTFTGLLKDAASIIKAVQDIEQEQHSGAGILGTYILWKDSIQIFNNTDKEVDVQCDKDLFTDHHGGTLASKQMVGFARRGATNVLINGKSACNLVPGNRYVVEPDGSVKQVVVKKVK